MYLVYKLKIPVNFKGRMYHALHVLNLSNHANCILENFQNYFFKKKKKKNRTRHNETRKLKIQLTTGNSAISFSSYTKLDVLSTLEYVLVKGTENWQLLHQ